MGRTIAHGPSLLEDSAPWAIFTRRFSQKKCKSGMHSLRITAELKKQDLQEKMKKREILESKII